MRLDGGGDRARLEYRAADFLSKSSSGAGPLIERIWGVQRTSGRGVAGTIGWVAARASTSRTGAFSNGRASDAFDVVRRFRIQQKAAASSRSVG